MSAPVATDAPTYTGAKAERLIRDKKATGVYHVGGWLDLSGCDLTGVTLPATVGGSLYLSGCKNPDPAQWWSEGGETTKRHCIAVSGYALIQTDADRFYAGCRKRLTRKQALTHWGGARTDARAVAFMAAINASALGASK